MKVERFFHLRRFGGIYPETRGGATVRVTGDTEHVGQVDVQVTFCSKKDVYCKKTGREVAAKAPVKVVPLRYLPQELKRIAEKAGCHSQFQDQSFAVRYFLPKE